MATNLKNACPNCRNVNELTATACRFCGNPLTPPQVAPPASARRRPRWPLFVVGLVALILIPVAGVIVASGNQAEPVTDNAPLQVGTDEGAALQFNPTSLTAPPNTEMQIIFLNQSNAVPHNLTFTDPIQGRTEQSIPPGGQQSISITTPGPGTYQFVCTLHLPTMVGQLTVAAAE